MNPERKRIARGAALSLTAALLGVPVVAAAENNGFQAIVESVKTPTFKSVLEFRAGDNMVSMAFPEKPRQELPKDRETPKPQYETFKKIIESSLNPELLDPFLTQMNKDLSENPDKYIEFSYEIGTQDIPPHFIYTYDGIELIVIDTGRNDKAPSQFILSMRMDKAISLSGHPDIVLQDNQTVTFSADEQVSFLEGIFKTSDNFRKAPWLPRQLIFNDQIPGVFRGYEDGNGIRHWEEANFTGLVSLFDIYDPSKPVEVEKEDLKSPVNPNFPLG